MTILKEYRINNGLKQSEMANKLQCGIQSYRLYENGKNVIPNKILLKFLRLRATPSDLELADVLEKIYEK
jgi:transcriptional regulator with XRE-family HTH domain